MWHEARRQEKKLRGMLVDYRKRAERRRDFYEKIKADPTQFLQLHGRPCKIHLDSAVAQAADSPATMMPWQGQNDNLIDRFDVRAHLDYIHPVVPSQTSDDTHEERQCNYERYRILAQNIFLGVNEEKFLKQLHLEEQFGYTASKNEEKKTKTGVAIGFNYDEPGKENLIKTEKNYSDSSDSDSDLDVDLCIDMSKIEQSQAHELNRCGQQFGMCSNDFYSFLINDMEEAENIRIAREEEHEKALYSGRKSRRERRAHRERRLANRIPSPPSYAARASPTYPAFRESKSNSKSLSPENTGQITYITSFGGEDELPSTSKPTYADKVKFGKKSENRKQSRKRSRSSSHSPKRGYRSKSSSRSPKRKDKIRDRSSSYSPRSIRRSRSKSPRKNTGYCSKGYFDKSFSRSHSRSPYSSKNRRSRSKSRSKSYKNRNDPSRRSKRSRSRSRSRSLDRYFSKNRSPRHRRGYSSKTRKSRSYSPRQKSYLKNSQKSRSRSRSPRSRHYSSSRNYRNRSKSTDLSSTDSSSAKNQKTIRKYSNNSSRSESSSPNKKFYRNSSRSRSRSSSRNRNFRSKSRSKTPKKASKALMEKYLRNKKYRRSRSPSSTSTSSTSSSSSSKISYRSRSNSVKQVKMSPKRAESPRPIQRYYGRRQEDKSSSDISDLEDNESKILESNPNSSEKTSVFGNSGSASKVIITPGPKLTPQERLKRKMQLLLNKQYKADKIAEQIRTERAQQEQRNREDELREMALKLRRKQRERRHAYDENSNSSNSDSSDSESSKAPSEESNKRSASPDSPQRKKQKDEENNSPYRKSKSTTPERSPKRQRIDNEKTKTNEKYSSCFKNNNSPTSSDYRKKRENYESKNRYDDNKKYNKLVDY